MKKICHFLFGFISIAIMWMPMVAAAQGKNQVDINISFPIFYFIIFLITTYTIVVIVLAYQRRYYKQKVIQLSEISKKPVEKAEDKEQKNSIMAENINMIINTLHWPICIVNPTDYFIIYSNNAFKELFGAEHGTKPDSLWEFFYEERADGVNVRQYIEEIFNEIQDTEGVIIEDFVSRRVDGSTITLRGNATQIVYNNEKAISVILQDISSEKEQEEVLRNTAKKEKEANQLKSKFIIKMSHEIRTPMNAIIGLTKIELLKTHEPEVFDVFHKINNAANILLAIINDILDFSNIEAQAIEVRKERFDFEKVVSKILFTYSQKLVNKKVEMLLHVDSFMPKYIYSDKNIITQMLKNVLDNAVKFTDFGKIVLNISIHREEESSWYSFCVEDSGIGMTEKDMSRIFQPFEQFAGSNQQASGTGLGVPITKQLAELLGGTVELDSQLDHGTKIRINIPIEEESVSEKIIEKSYYNILQGKKVLIVDDSQISCSIMNELLEYAGAEITTIQYAKEVIPHVKEVYQNGGSYDVFLLDYLLDQGTGIEIGKSIKDLVSQNVKILMVSAYSRFHLDELDKENLFHEIIDKPFVPTVFYTKICNALNGIERETKKSNQMYHFPNAKVLVCEDNFINQEVIKGILQFYSIEPVIVNNGREGLDALEKTEFELVIMDIMMPVMDGHAATQAIRESNEYYRNIPIVAMTANAMSEEIEVCMKEGMNGYITKPVDLNVLYQELLKWLKGEARAEDIKAKAADSDAMEAVSSPEESNQASSKMPEKIPGDDAVETLRLLTQFGVDVNTGIERFGGKASVYQKTLERFLQDTMQEGMLSSDVLEHGSEAEIEEFKRYIHSMKGVTGNLSLINTHNMLKKFEEGLKLGSPDIELYRQIEQIFMDKCKKSLEILKGNREQVVSQGNKEECIMLLIKLKEFLLQGRAKECEEYITLLREKNWEAFEQKDIESICSFVEAYDYQTAIGFIESIVGE